MSNSKHSLSLQYIHGATCIISTRPIQMKHIITKQCFSVCLSAR